MMLFCIPRAPQANGLWTIFADAPEPLVNKSMEQVISMTNWTPEMIEDLQQSQRYMVQKSYCTESSEVGYPELHSMEYSPPQCTALQPQ